jgi:glucokinase
MSRALSTRENASRGAAGTLRRPPRANYNDAMILAADVGGSKTLVGVFADTGARPQLVHAHAVRTLDYDGLAPLLEAFLAGHPGVAIDRVGLGVAGPILDGEATLTNVPWRVRQRDVTAVTGVGTVQLLNDLEAMGHAVPVLAADELRTLRAGRPNPAGNAALIAAGTGLGEAVLHRVEGRLRPVPSEGGHADFAPRTDAELDLFRTLRARFGRVEVEHVVSGLGLVNIAAHTHGGETCAVAGRFVEDDSGAARVSTAGAAGQCAHCADALQLFVGAYGAEAGNLALRAVATAGLYVGGGIAPKLLDSLDDGAFLAAFTDKPPMDTLLADIPVHVILNDRAGLIGAAVAAAAV